MSLLEVIGFVKRGKNRQKVFLSLNKPKIPSEIVKIIYGKANNTYFNLVSRALGELRTKKLIEVVNPQEKTGRIYQRTKFGNEVEKKLRELN